MTEYKDWERKRKVKQLGMSLGFIAIIIGGWFYPWLGYFIPLCMLLGLGIGLSRGRKWCDWYCPRGSFYDALIKPLSPKKGIIPPICKNIYFRIGVLSLLLAVMIINLIMRWPLEIAKRFQGLSPGNSLNFSGPDPNKIGMFFVIMLTATTVLGIILAVIFHQRSWCCICPIGTLSKLVGRNKYPLKINSDLCTECKLCTQVCPIQIKPYIFKDKGVQIVKDADCLKCGLCVVACPAKALSLGDRK